jgi:hypothetical protein
MILLVFKLLCIVKKHAINSLPVFRCSEKALTKAAGSAYFRRQHFSLSVPNDRFLARRGFRRNGSFF